jgi:hypothetical protein
MVRAFARYANLAWSGLLLAAMSAFIVSGSGVSLVLAGGTLGYFVIACCNVADCRWARLLTLAATVVVALLSGTVVLVNAAMFAMGHALYRDSPATILVVFIYAVVLTAPALLIALALIADMILSRQRRSRDSAACSRATA